MDSRLIKPYKKGFRDPEYLKYLSSQPCVISGEKATENHHVMFRERKKLDCFCISLAPKLHYIIHHGTKYSSYEGLQAYCQDQLGLSWYTTEWLIDKSIKMYEEYSDKHINRDNINYYRVALWKLDNLFEEG